MSRFQNYACSLTVIVIIWAILVGLYPPDTKGRIAEDFSSVPTELAEWYSLEGKFDLDTYKALPTCSLLDREYRDNNGNTVYLTIVYGRNIGDFHQPERCMEGNGWYAVTSKTILIRPKGLKPHKATVVRLTNKLHPDLVMVYWFYMAGDIVPAKSKQGLLVLLEGLFKTDVAPSAMVKYTAIIDSSEEEAENSAIRLAEELGKYIVDMASRPVKYEPVDAVYKRLDLE